jgi:hypothetical protein
MSGFVDVIEWQIAKSLVDGAHFTWTVFERDRTPTDWLLGYRLHINTSGARAMEHCLASDTVQGVSCLYCEAEHSSELPGLRSYDAFDILLGLILSDVSIYWASPVYRRRPDRTAANPKGLARSAIGLHGTSR